jgi:hypothetical protein
MEEMKENAKQFILGDDLNGEEETPINANNSNNADEGYFNTYSHFAIHHEMLTVSLSFNRKKELHFHLKKYRLNLLKNKILMNLQNIMQ